MVIVDTSVWVQFLRLRGSPEHQALDQLLAQNEAAIVGAVLAELLQGERPPQRFQRFRDTLMSVPYLPETKETWARAADLSYALRRQGQALPLVDLLIASLAMEHDCEVYTLDQDFQQIPGLKLYDIAKLQC